MMPDLDTKIEEANFYNQFDINDAQIIHWHSSRGIENRLHLMKDVCDRVDVPIVYCVGGHRCKLLEQSFAVLLLYISLF